MPAGNSAFLAPAPQPNQWVYDINPATGNGRATFLGEIVAPSLPSGGITQLTGNVTAGPGSGSQVATIVNGAVTLAMLAANSVDQTKIVDGSVGNAELAANAVQTTNITDANVTTAKIAALAITFGLIATAAVATTAEFLSNTASKLVSVATAWAAAVPVTVTFAASQTLDFSTFQNAKITLTANITLNAPTNTKNGQTGCIELIQDATGSRTATWNAQWIFAGGTDPVLSTAANARDLLFYQVLSDGKVYGNVAKAVA